MVSDTELVIEILHDILSQLKRLNSISKNVLTVDDLVEYTNMSKSHIYKLTSQGSIPHNKPNGKILYFEKQQIDNWLIQNNS